MGKVLDTTYNAIIGDVVKYAVSLAFAGLTWLFCSPLWGGWHAVCIAIAAGVMFAGILHIAVHKKTNASPDLEEKILLGSWVVTNTSDERHIAIWEFFADKVCKGRNWHEGSFRGTWAMEDGCVRITWEKCEPDGRPHWDTFLRPLKLADVHGDNWTARPDSLRASKIHAAS